MNELVSDESDRSSGEAGQPCERHWSVFPHYPLNDLEPVLNDGAFRCPCSWRSSPARPSHREGLPDPPILQDLNPVGQLTNNRPGIAPDKGITSQMLAAFNRLEQKRLCWSSDFAIRRKRGLDVRQQTPSHWYEIALT